MTPGRLSGHEIAALIHRECARITYHAHLGAVTSGFLHREGRGRYGYRQLAYHLPAASGNTPQAMRILYAHQSRALDRLRRALSDTTWPGTKRVVRTYPGGECLAWTRYEPLGTYLAIGICNLSVVDVRSLAEDMLDDLLRLLDESGRKRQAALLREKTGLTVGTLRDAMDF